MKIILGSAATALMGVLLVTYGSLLAFRPDTFLWFHDTFIDRSRWNRTAAWRQHVHEPRYKVVGALFAVIGALILGYLLLVGLGR